MVGGPQTICGRKLEIMGKIVSAIMAVTLAAGPLLLPVSARAENGQIAAGVVGGLIGGALLGGALASPPAPPPPVYYAPEPIYVPSLSENLRRF